MSTDLPRNESSGMPLTIGKALRYLLRDAVKDFNSAMNLGRLRRDNVISSEEFTAEMARRFPATTEPKP